MSGFTSSVIDYNSHQLDIYSDDNKCHLFLRDGKTNPAWAPGFGVGQKFQYLRYTEVGDAGYMHPIVIAGLYYLDTNGFVSGVGWSFYEVKNSISTETKAREDADTKLTTDLGAESKARADADSKLTTDLTAESKARADADDFLQAQVNGLWGGVQSNENDSKNRDSALDVKIQFEKTRAETAEGKVQANIDDEAKARADADTKLSDRIDFIVSNTNPSAIDSLSEIVAQFSQNGAGYADRLTYLEGVVAALVNKVR
jgi:hypothetical protein